MGHLEKSGIIPLRHLQEFRLQSVEGYEPNQRLVLEELFNEGDLVDVSGTTIGKGFQGILPLSLPPLFMIFICNYLRIYTQFYIHVSVCLGWYMGSSKIIIRGLVVNWHVELARPCTDILLFRSGLIVFKSKFSALSS